MRTFIAFIACVIIAGSLSAQPGLTVHRIVNNWPIIELYYTASCNGTDVFNLDSTQIHLSDNGTPVTSFTHSCADPTISNPISASLVLDASGSMAGAGNIGTRRAFSKFVIKFDDVQDEAGIVYFNSIPWTGLGMTHDSFEIWRAIEALPARGATVLWDAIYMGIIQADSGTNPIRSVIAITDGGESSSTHTIQDVIELAQKKNIRVFVLGLGGVYPGSIDLVPMLTGGKYYSCPDTSLLTPALDDIYATLRGGYFDCRISYDATQICPDFRLHSVQLSISDLCGGIASDSKQYSAPGSWILPWKPVVWFDTLCTAGNDTAAVGLWITMDSTKEIPPTEFRIAYNDSELEYLTADFSGSIFAANIPSIVPGSGSLVMKTSQPVTATGTQLLGLFTFVRQTQGIESSVVSIDTVSAAPDCFRTLNAPGIISFAQHVPVYAHNDTVLCHNGKITLSAADGFADYAWNTGATGRYIIVTEPGTYSFTAHTPDGAGIASEEVTVTRTPYPIVSIVNVPGDTINVCAESQFILEATAGFVRYDWGKGSQTSRFHIPSSKRLVSVSATDSCGCVSTSQRVYYNQPTIYAASPSFLRSGDTLVVFGSIGPWQWYYNGNPIAGTTDSSLVMTQDGEYFLQTMYFDTCTAVSGVYRRITTAVAMIPEIPALDVSVFPNPAGTGSIIRVGGASLQPVRYELYDLNGALVWYKETDEMSPAFPAMPPGVYLLRARQGEAFGYAKVSVK